MDLVVSVVSKRLISVCCMGCFFEFGKLDGVGEGKGWCYLVLMLRYFFFVVLLCCVFF